jgi:predicted Zn-dependent protease
MRLFIPLLAALLLAPAHAENLPDLGDPSQVVFSPQQEKQLGESIMRQIRASRFYMDEPQVADYVNALGYRLVAHSPDAEQSFQFFVIDDQSINAFALPGGFIGVFTGLIVNAQTESELASVLAHEIAHVTQRHIARLFQQQKQASLASLAAIALAILASRSSADLASAAIAGSRYATLQGQLNFTRDNEREADRVGVQVLERSGFDPSATPAFLERLQRAYRLYETNAPAYMRTHPLTYERIADVQARVDSMPYRQVPDSLDFQLVRARLQVLGSPPREAVERYDDILREKKTVNEAPARYGLTLALLEAKNLERAQREAALLQRTTPEDPMILELVARVRAAGGDRKAAAALYAEGVKRFPRRRALIYGYAEALLEAKQPREALQVITEAIRALPPDARLYSLQARCYAALDQRLQQHRAQAEAYLLMGSLPGAIEQLQIGLKSADGDYFEMSSAEARLRELTALDLDSRRKQ